MTVYRDEFWAIDGVPIETYAFGLEVVSEPGPSGLRGQNVPVAQRHGALWVRKWRSPASRTLSGWVTDADASGATAATRAERRAQRNENLAALNRLFSRSRRLLTVERRIRMASGLITLEGAAEVVESYDYQTVGDLHNALLRYNAVLLFPDPLWYQAAVTGSAVAVAGSAVYDVAGTAETSRLDVVLEGPLTNPTVSNDTLGVSVTYTGVIDTGETVTIDAYQGTAVHDVDGSVLAGVSHDGDPLFMVLDHGENTVSLAADAGTGTARIDYRPAWV